MTQDRLDVLKPRAVWIFGRATFTIVASRTTMSWATRMTASSRPRWCGACWGVRKERFDMGAPQR